MERTKRHRCNLTLRWHDFREEFWFCPYCGEKLELPDVKIEVSRKVLVGWFDGLDEALQDGIFCYGSPAILRIKQAMQGIGKVLNDD